MRIKRGTVHARKRARVLKQTKGYRWGRKSKISLARTAILKAGVKAYRDRKEKKRNNKALWNIRINAAARPLGVSYSVLLGKLRKAGVILDRKILAELGAKYPAVFEAVVKLVK